MTLEAVQVLREGPQAPRPRLHDCQRMVMAHYQALADRFVQQSDPPRDLERLTALIGELPGRLTAIEAMWDGDTDGWFMLLVAALDAPQREVELAVIRHGSDLRIFNGPVPPWPESQEAVRTGTALAGRFSVPFHFASPDEPDDGAPRWRASRS